MKVLSLVAAVMAASVAFGLQRASNHWRADTEARVAQLEAGTPGAPRRYTASLVRDLPPPVARYFKHVLREGQPFILSAVLTQQADFFIGDAWRPLTATQHFTSQPPGFVWDAAIQMAPLMPAYVRDAYVGGHGWMQASMFGLYSLADQSGKPELDSGALQRFLGESVWLPTALLPGPAVTWAVIDDRRALATLTDARTTVSLTFSFDDRDEITEMTGDRFFEDQGAYTLRPWRVTCKQYDTQDGMLIPVQCEVSWMMPEGAKPYWRGRITSSDYVF